MSLPRNSDGKLDTQVIKQVLIVLSKDFEIPELAVAQTDYIFYVEPISKNLMTEIISSGLTYKERSRISAKI